MHQNWHLEVMLHTAATILDLLPLRQWSLIAADETAGVFICTENPVLLTWTEEMPTMFGPGFGVGSTDVGVIAEVEDVRIPLSRDAPAEPILGASELRLLNRLISPPSAGLAALRPTQLSAKKLRNSCPLRLGFDAVEGRAGQAGRPRQIKRSSPCPTSRESSPYLQP